MTAWEALLWLTARGLSNADTPADTEGIPWETVLRLARFHSMAAITENGLNGLDVPEEVRKSWREDAQKAVRRRMLFDAERREILAFMEQEGIWYAPLKGVVLQDLYPKFGMREMSDNDILYDADRAKEIQAFMLGRGYEKQEFGAGVDDEYVREPVCHFEMHRLLFNPVSAPELGAYYRDVKNRLCKDEDNRCGWHFSDEDFYVYLMAHAYRHFSGGGTGIRILADTAVWFRTRGKGMDRVRVRRELEACGAAEFAAVCQRLAVLLSDPEKTVEGLRTLPEADVAVLDRMLNAGTYGTIANGVQSSMEQIQPEGGRFTLRTRFRYLLSRLFPAPEVFQTLHPAVARHRVLYPFYIVYRLVSKLFREGTRVIEELKTIWNINRTDRK